MRWVRPLWWQRTSSRRLGLRLGRLRLLVGTPYPRRRRRRCPHRNPTSPVFGPCHSRRTYRCYVVCAVSRVKGGGRNRLVIVIGIGIGIGKRSLKTHLRKREETSNNNNRVWPHLQSSSCSTHASLLPLSPLPHVVLPVHQADPTQEHHLVGVAKTSTRERARVWTDVTCFTASFCRSSGLASDPCDDTEKSGLEGQSSRQEDLSGSRQRSRHAVAPKHAIAARYVQRWGGCVSRQSRCAVYPGPPKSLA